MSGAVEEKTRERSAISPLRSENFPEWYQQVVKAADLAEISPVRGCMVIKPWGYAIWELMQRRLDDRFKKLGHQNAYFPLFIPLRYFEKEAEHVEGFAKECAVVTHSRLEADGEGGLRPASALDEPLIVRPTSETIIGEMFAKWVNSYRDLPVKINQWANVVRWEMRTRMFLRTTEFLWQEGHCAFATAEEALEETVRMLECYREFAEDDVALPVICGRKTPSERFPGAVETFTIEAMMQDGKALQSGTSHFLGQNFAKSANISFVNEHNQEAIAWTMSFGVSTRMVGAMIMGHSDDNGLVLPPVIAPMQIVLLPIAKEENQVEVWEYCERLKNRLQQLRYKDMPLRVHIDKRDIRGGGRSWEWIKKGVPMRIEIGMRDIQNGTLCLYRRDRSHREKIFIKEEEFLSSVLSYLDNIHDTIFEKARHFREEHSKVVTTREEFFDYFESGHTGFVYAYWCGDPEIEKELKEKLSVTSRCLPLSMEETGPCVFTGKPGAKMVIWAKSY